MKQIKNHLLYILILFTLVSCSELKTIKSYGLTPPTIELKKNKAYVNGALGKIFYKKLKKIIDKNPNLETIVLLDIPGSVDDEWNLKSCQLIYEKGLNTELLKNSIVESGGTDLFVSGKKLIIADGAKIGVHSWGGGEKSATEYPKNHLEHKMFLDFYNKVDIDTSFYWFTIKAAPADGMYFMTKQEIKKYFGNKIKE